MRHITMNIVRQNIVRMLVLCMVMWGAGTAWAQTNKLVTSANQCVDDYYLDGGITFDVSGDYTTFAWYSSKTKPAVDADFIADASKFMVVKTNADHVTTNIVWTKTLGDNPTNATPQKADNSSYAYKLWQADNNVRTVVDELHTRVLRINGKDVDAKFYAPEATAAGNKWHYLRQLDDHTEAYVDYVWCVASNEAGSQSLTSDVVEITVHPARSQVYAVEGYESTEMERMDFHLPSIYTGMYYNGKMEGKNVVLYTQYPGEDEIFPKYVLGEKERIGAEDVTSDLTAALFHVWSGPGAGATVTNDNGNGVLTLNTSTDCVYGLSNLADNNYADISNYDLLLITYRNDGYPRIMFNQTSGAQIIVSEQSNTDYYAATDNGDGTKTGTVDIKKFVEDKGFAHLNSIKASAYDTKVTATSLKVVKYADPADYTDTYPDAPSVALTFFDEDGNAYRTADDKKNYLAPANKTGQWIGPDVELAIADLVPSLNENTSAHKLYKDLPITNIPFVYRTQAKEAFSNRSGFGLYQIGPSSQDIALTRAEVRFYFDYSNDAPSTLGSVSEKTVWDWKQLSSKQTECFNLAEGHVVTHENETDAQHRTVMDNGTEKRITILDDEKYIVGPVMGNEYVMSDFYTYSMSELGGIDFPADKLQIGLECFNDNQRNCMQGNAFVIKPTKPGTLEIVFSSTNGGTKRNLVLNSRVYNNDGTYKEYTRERYDDDTVGKDQTSSNVGEADKRTITMKITEDMVGSNKVIAVRAKNWSGRYEPPVEEPGLKNKLTPDPSTGLNGQTLIIVDDTDTHMQVLGRSSQNADAIECAAYSATDYGRIKFTKVTDATDLPADVNASNLYTMQILNETNSPYQLWGGTGYLNFSPWWSLHALGKETGNTYQYGTDYIHGGLWEVTASGDGYVIRNVGTFKKSITDTNPTGTFYYYNPAGNGSTTPVVCHLYERIVADPNRAEDNVGNQYFSVYKATYTPNVATVDFKEWIVKDRAVGGEDVYQEVYDSKTKPVTEPNTTDGYVSMSVDEAGAKIYYKFYPGMLTKDEYDNPSPAQKAVLDTLSTYAYIDNVYRDSEGHALGFHAKKNGTLIAWAVLAGKNNSEPVLWQTHGTPYPIDMRFWKSLTKELTDEVTNQTEFNSKLWGNNEAAIADRSTDEAPKAWEGSDPDNLLGDVKKYATVYFDDIEYTEENYKKGLFDITHGSVVDIKVVPNDGYIFAGWGAPAVVGGVVRDLMRSAKSTHVQYHLLYDKAKAKSTDGVAFLMGYFKERGAAKFTAELFLQNKEDATYVYKIPLDVNADDEVYAPVYHAASYGEDKTMSHWTEDHTLREADGHIQSGATEDTENYRDYMPGQPATLHESILLKPVFRDNIYLDNLDGRLKTATVTWRFDRQHYAQTLTVKEEFPGFFMPYVAPVLRSEVGKVAVGAADDTFFDVPLHIYPGATGRLDNTVVSDWCSVGRGTTFQIPSCPNAVVQMEVRSPLNATEKGTKFGGETPVLIKVKYQDEADYVETSTPDPLKTVEAYIYQATYTGAEETIDIVMGNDYSYIRTISVTLPPVISKRDAALITTDFTDLGLGGSAQPPYGEGETGDGYNFVHGKGKSTFTTHYSGESGTIYFDGVSVLTGKIVGNEVPYVHGWDSYTKSTVTDGMFILGPFRSITHIRYQQGCSVREGGGWTMQVGRAKNVPETATVDWFKDENNITWGEAKYGSIHNSTTPEWVEMDVEEHIYPDGKDNSDVSLIEDPDFEKMAGDTYLRFKADIPEVYLFNIELYGIDPTGDKQATLETGIFAIDDDDDETYESTFRAGSIFHFPYLLELDENYQPLTDVKVEGNKIMQFNEGREVTLSATANIGYEFVKWITTSDEDADENSEWTLLSTENPCTFTMDGSKHVRAVFVHRGFINYLTKTATEGVLPEQQQTDAAGGFTVAENRGLFSSDGKSLVRWEDSELAWYTANDGNGTGLFPVSTRTVSEGYAASNVDKSRGVLGTQVDVYPVYQTNDLTLLDVSTKKGVPVRWDFGKKNGAPTMYGSSTTPYLVSQATIRKHVDELKDDGSGTTQGVEKMQVIDVPIYLTKVRANNAGRADVYATISTDNAAEGITFTLPATKGMRVTGQAKEAIYVKLGDSEWKKITAGSEDVLEYLGNDATVTLQIRGNDIDGTPGTYESSFDLSYIQATYYPRIQKPIVAILREDIEGMGDVRVQVNTSANPTATRYYTKDGSTPKPGAAGTFEMLGDFITVTQAEIKAYEAAHPGEQFQLKVIATASNRPDSEVATLDLVSYDDTKKLATYVYDSRVTNLHEDQIFKKLLSDHGDYFNLMSFDINPSAGQIPEVVVKNTAVFVTSDDLLPEVQRVLVEGYTYGSTTQNFTANPLIVGTPLYVYWRSHPETPTGSEMWMGMSWDVTLMQYEQQHMAWVLGGKVGDEPQRPVRPADGVYTEFLRGMKTQNPSNPDGSIEDDYKNKTYEYYFRNKQFGEGAESKTLLAANEPYVLDFFDHMLIKQNSGSPNGKVSISLSSSIAPKDLNDHGTQLVFNATKLLTSPTADLTSYARTLRTMMSPTKNPQLIDMQMSMTAEVNDYEGSGWQDLQPYSLGELSDGITHMYLDYLPAVLPQFRGETVNNIGKVEVTNVRNVSQKTTDDAADNHAFLGDAGIADLATIFTVTHPEKTIGEYKDPGDDDFNRQYRVEYEVAIDSVVFYKDGGVWKNDTDPLWELTEQTKTETGGDGNSYTHPVFYVQGPTNRGIKNVNFDGYAIAPDAYFDAEGNIKTDTNTDGTPRYSIWGRGELYDAGSTVSPTANAVTGGFIPEYKNETPAADRTPKGDWMCTEFNWGYKDCYRMAFSLLNVTDYEGQIKVKFYKRQAEAPKLVYANVHDNIEVERNGEFVLEFNSVMHEVRVPGKYDDATVTWTAHIIPDDLGGGISYGAIKNDNDKIDQNDVPEKQIWLTAEGGSNTLRFQYWHLENGKKYWLHIPFSILRGAVGEGAPYSYDASGEFEQNLSYTDYPGVPYFDIPFTVAASQYAHGGFNYIVNSDNWWDAYKETGSATCAASLPSYAKWDGDFTAGIDKIQEMQGRDHPHFYMHVQKQKDNGKYTYGTDGLMQIKASNFSIVGEGSDSTVVTAEPAAYTDSDYRGLREDVTGNKTATLHLDASNVYMQGLTIQNTQAGLNQDGQEYPAVFDHGNRNVYYDVNIDGYEESFAVFGSLGYLEKCRIGGYGDFVVGNGNAWLDSCKITLRNRVNINLCAPSTKATYDWGFVFNDCHIDREEGADFVRNHNWTLARPWGGYDEMEVLKSPAVTFLNTKLTVLPTNTGYGALTPNLRLRFHEYGTYQNDKGNMAPLGMRSVSNCTPLASSESPALTKEQADEYSIRNMFGRDNDGYDPQALTRQAKAPVLTNDGMVLHWKADPSDLCYLVYYLGDGEAPDWDNAMMFCCVPGTDDEEAYCYLTDHDRSPIFRTKENGTPMAFSELWYGRRKQNGADKEYTEDIPGMGKGTPSRLWYAVRAANQMGGLSPMSNALMYHAARQYRTTITKGGVLKGDEASGNAYSTIYLNFQALAPEGVKAYALTDVTSTGGDDAAATTLTFTRVSKSTDPKHQDVVYADQGYLIYGPYTDDVNSSQTSKNHVFIETTSLPDVDLDSYFSGTVGTFLDRVSEEGLGEKNDVNAEIGWSISPDDYESVPVGNVSAYTLQKYNNLLGFYKYTGANLSHHRAYLNTETAARVLMDKEGLSHQEAQQRLSRGMRILIDDDGTLMDVTSVFMDYVEPKEIYDLMGRRIYGTQSLKPGTIYIIDGKKVLWKK